MKVLIWKNVFILFRSLLLTYLLRKMPWRYRFFRLTIKWRWDEKVRSWPPRSKSLWFIFLGQYDLYKFRFKTVYFPKLAHFRKSSLLNDKARSLIVINSPVSRDQYYTRYILIIVLIFRLGLPNTAEIIQVCFYFFFPRILFTRLFFQLIFLLAECQCHRNFRNYK